MRATSLEPIFPILCAVLVAGGLTACPDDPVTPSDLDDHDDHDDDAGGGSDTGVEQDTDGEEDAALDTSESEDTGADVTADTGEGGSIAIYLAGDMTPFTVEDGLVGQTPTDYRIALSRYEVLLSLDDASPAPCFDHGDSPTIADMAGDALMGSCATKDIPTGVYTHGRVKVEWSIYTVRGQLHYANMVLPGNFTFFRAWSDTSYEGERYQANQGWVRYSGVTEVELPWTWPAWEDAPGFRSELNDGEFLLTFPYGRPLLVVEDDLGEHWARFHWHVESAFRWRDEATADFVEDAWDVVPPPGASEAVLAPGVTGYHVTTSLD